MDRWRELGLWGELAEMFELVADLPGVDPMPQEVDGHYEFAHEDGNRRVRFVMKTEGDACFASEICLIRSGNQQRFARVNPSNWEQDSTVFGVDYVVQQIREFLRT